MMDLKKSFAIPRMMRESISLVVVGQIRCSYEGNESIIIYNYYYYYSKSVQFPTSRSYDRSVTRIRYAS